MHAATTRLFTAIEAFRDALNKRVAECNAMMEREVLGAASAVAHVSASASVHIAQLRSLLFSFSENARGSSSVHTLIASQSKLVDDFAGLALRDLRALVTRLDSASARGEDPAAILGEVRRMATGTLETTARFGNAFRPLSAALQAFLVNQEKELNSTLSRSNETLEAIGDAFSSALSHLQFQDVVSQGLRRLDAHVESCQLTLCEALNAPDLEPRVRRGNYREVGGEKPVGEAESGEVSLF